MTEPNKPAGPKPAPGTTAPTGAGSQGPTPEQQQRGVEAASAAPGERRSVSPPPAGAASAAESGDPAVQKALGDLQTAQQNLADAQGGPDRDQRIAAAEQAVQDARDRLGELGYE